MGRKSKSTSSQRTDRKARDAGKKFKKKPCLFCKDGASWVERPVSSNLQGNMVAPLDRTELLQTVMTGSPEQARLEQYRLRMGEIHALLTRIAATEKQLSEAVDKAAQRPDMFTF